MRGEKEFVFCFCILLVYVWGFFGCLVLGVFKRWRYISYTSHLKEMNEAFVTDLFGCLRVFVLVLWYLVCRKRVCVIWESCKLLKEEQFCTVPGWNTDHTEGLQQVGCFTQELWITWSLWRIAASAGDSLQPHNSSCTEQLRWWDWAGESGHALLSGLVEKKSLKDLRELHVRDIMQPVHKYTRKARFGCWSPPSLLTVILW